MKTQNHRWKRRSS